MQPPFPQIFHEAIENKVTMNAYKKNMPELEHPNILVRVGVGARRGWGL